MNLLRIAAFLLLSLTARADFITGHVVNSQGVGIPGIDIDVKNLGGGGDPPIFNDGTDVNGFFNTTVPNGLYRITFTPPTTASSLPMEICDVVVVGTLDMGIIMLDAGIQVSGRVLDSGGFPVSGLNLDALVLSTDEKLDPFPNDTTDAFGQFTVVLPLEPTELQLLPGVLFGLAPQAVEVDSPSAVALGDFILQPGFILSANVREAATLLPLTGVDLDVIDTLTGETLFTPGDNSTVGFLDVTVPAGTYELVFCPSATTGLAASGLDGVVVAGALHVGDVDHAVGVPLTGTVTDTGGQALQGVDIDLRDSVTQAGVFLCRDGTNPAGAYSILAPAGTYDVTFTGLGLDPLTIPNVDLTMPATLNASMGIQYPSLCNGDGGDQMGCTDCPCMNNSPQGTVGGCLNSAGTSSRLIATGDASLSLPSGSTTDLRLQASGMPPSSFGVLISGNAVAPANMANPCFGQFSGVQFSQFDGLRCAVQQTRRHGGRASNGSGVINDSSGPSRVWGGEAQPPAGIGVQAGFVAGQTRYFQINHREDAMLGCMRGLNNSQAVEVAFVP